MSATMVVEPDAIGDPVISEKAEHRALDDKEWPVVNDKSVEHLTRSELISEVNTLRRQLAETRHVEVYSEKYRMLLDESSDPIFAFSPEGRYHYVNRAFAEGVCRSLEDIIGKTIWDVFSKEEADKRYAAVKWVFENASSQVIEVRVPRPDGDHYYVTTVKPILGAGGVVDYVICISKEITERKNMEEKLKRVAEYDSLTELPNRALFSDRLQQAIARARRDNFQFALMFVDLDDFKPINDTFGHHAGDLLLQAVAKRMLECTRESDTVGRIGGDEFVVLLPKVAQAQDALSVAEKIRSALALSFDIQGYGHVKVSSSIGVAIFPEHGEDAITLSRNADNAMYQAKSRGNNAVHLYGIEGYDSSTAVGGDRASDGAIHCPQCSAIADVDK
jgi:diguanylate cyclase (GGDEF)-like protein/PAS domain S-box-containing protein